MPRGRLFHFASLSRGRRTVCVSVILAQTLACSHSGFPDSPTGQRGTIDPSTLLVWHTQNVGAFTRPLVDGDRVFFSNAGSHQVTALDKVSGKVLWRTSIVLPDTGLGGFGLTIAGGRLVVGDAEVYGLDPATGAIAWHFVPSDGKTPGFGRLSSDGTMVYLCSGFGAYVYGVDGVTGAQRWATKLLQHNIVLVYNTVVDAGMVFVGFTDFDVTPGPGEYARVNGGVAGLDANTGNLVWLTILPKPDTTLSGETHEVAVARGYVFAGGHDGTVYALDEHTGAIRQSVPRTTFTPPGVLPQPDIKEFAVSGDFLIVGSLASTVTGITISDFQRSWQLDMRGHGSVNDVVADSDLVYTAYHGGGFSVSRLRTGELVWVADAARSGFDEIANGPAVDGARIYLGGFNDAYAMKRE